MDIEIREVKTHKEMKKFIYLPEKIHAGSENWVHPIYQDEWKYFNPDKNKAFPFAKQFCCLPIEENMLLAG
jgi:hypothetical protein